MDNVAVAELWAVAVVGAVVAVPAAVSLHRTRVDADRTGRQEVAGRGHR
jgi:hypothetical protein